MAALVVALPASNRWWGTLKENGFRAAWMAQATLMDAPRELPKVLYKYMPANRSKIFEDWLIRFTQPKALNDPFEMRPHIAGYGTPEEVRAIATERWEEHAREYYAELVQIRADG